jgi:hypothetical protein
MEKTRKSVTQTSTKETARPYGAGRFLFNGSSSRLREVVYMCDSGFVLFLLFATGPAIAVAALANNFLMSAR